jgi:ribosomal protein S12 methylthiotransferase
MLGCPKNDVDAEAMLYRLREAGHGVTADPNEADVIIVNTCGFIKDAKQESVNMLLEMARCKQTGRCRLLVASGCLPQRYRQELFDAMPEVDMMIGVNDYARIDELIDEALDAGGRMLRCGEPAGLPGAQGRVVTSPGSYAYLKIAEGCSNRCAYCAIPDIRGPYRSRGEEDILQEARWLTEQGALELILVAQDTTRYGMDLGQGRTLCGLLRKLVKIDGLGRLRLLYCYPELITDELLDLVSGEEKICGYIDVPLQHIDDGVLRRMNRRSGEAQIRALIEKIRTKYDLALRTTFITGFPGEGEEEYRKLLAFVGEARFDHLGVFAFSPEEGTPAYRMRPRVPQRVAAERRHNIMALQQRISKEILASKVGKTYRALCDGANGKGLLVCRSEEQSPEIDGAILLKGKPEDFAGGFFNVEITGASEYDMRGIRI